MKIGFHKAATPRQMTAAQRREFDKSYASYAKYYAKNGPAFEAQLTKDEYFEAYKLKRRELVSQGKTVAAVPRQVAAEQKYERSWFQDKAQYKALKETASFKKMHGDMSFAQFRKLAQEDLDEFLWEEINQFRADEKALGMSEKEINSFISQYYFGSPI